MQTLYNLLTEAYANYGNTVTYIIQRTNIVVKSHDVILAEYHYENHNIIVTTY
jgi:hypothetical protein